MVLRFTHMYEQMAKQLRAYIRIIEEKIKGD